MNHASKPVEEVIAAIQALDLDPIKHKLMDAEEGQGWSREYAERMEIAYKRFLTLLVKYPDETIAPTKDVDKFWHGHILDTLKYAEDCRNVFGYFLHHYPYLGMRGADDAENQRAAAVAMHRLYEAEFGEPLSASAFCTAVRPAFCTAVRPETKTDAAFCTAVKPAAAFCTAVKAAFCTALRPATKADAAFCTAVKPAAAFCTAVKAAFCTAVKPATKAGGPFCTAIKPASVLRLAPERV
jgi:hypothetical protein